MGPLQVGAAVVGGVAMGLGAATGQPLVVLLGNTILSQALGGITGNVDIAKKVATIALSIFK